MHTRAGHGCKGSPDPLVALLFFFSAPGIYERASYQQNDNFSSFFGLRTRAADQSA